MSLLSKDMSWSYLSAIPESRSVCLRTVEKKPRERVKRQLSRHAECTYNHEKKKILLIS